MDCGEDVHLDLQPSKLLGNEDYLHRTCGMEVGLVRELRAANNESSALKALCERVLQQMSKRTGESAGVVIAPPMGKVYAAAASISGLPKAVIWLLLDPTDIDSKQTTFVNIEGGGVERVFSSLYKLSAHPKGDSTMLSSVSEEHAASDVVSPIEPDV